MQKCNRCRLDKLTEDAEKNNSCVRCFDNSSEGTDVYVVPKGTEVQKRTETRRGPHYACWMMRIPTSCTCGGD